MMGQTVKAIRSKEGVTKEVGPFAWGTVAGEHDAVGFIAHIDDVIEVFGCGRQQRLETELIEDEQVDAQVALQALFPTDSGVMGLLRFEWKAGQWEYPHQGT